MTCKLPIEYLYSGFSCLYCFTYSCFLSNAIVFWVAFLGPIFAIILFNVVVYIIVITILIKHTRGSMARKNESLNSKTLIRLMMSIAGVMFLFGLSWLFGALTITVQGVRIAFQILFAIFTSLQGFFIFLFFCVFSQEARELWKESLSCGRYKSKILNPNLKGTSTGADKQRKFKNGHGVGTSTGYTSKETVSTFKPSNFSSTEMIVNCQDSSVDDHYSEPPEKIDLSKDNDVTSTADEVVAETDIDDRGDRASTQEAADNMNLDIQVDLEDSTTPAAPEFIELSGEVEADVEMAAEEMRVKFE